MGIIIKDIARISGVGISTVSRVLNNTGYVSDEVRQKVMKTVRDLNYIPNISARNLKSNDSKNIAIPAKGITNPFFNKIIRVIEEKAALRGYSLIIQNVDDHVNELDLAIWEARSCNPEITAVFAFTDVLALGAMKAAFSMSLTMPYSPKGDPANRLKISTGNPIGSLCRLPFFFPDPESSFSQAPQRPSIPIPYRPPNRIMREPCDHKPQLFPRFGRPLTRNGDSTRIYHPSHPQDKPWDFSPTPALSFSYAL